MFFPVKPQIFLAPLALFAALGASASPKPRLELVIEEETSSFANDCTTLLLQKTKTLARRFSVLNTLYAESISIENELEAAYLAPTRFSADKILRKTYESLKDRLSSAQILQIAHSFSDAVEANNLIYGFIVEKMEFLSLQELAILLTGLASVSEIDEMIWRFAAFHLTNFSTESAVELSHMAQDPRVSDLILERHAELVKKYISADETVQLIESTRNDESHDRILKAIVLPRLRSVQIATLVVLASKAKSPKVAEELLTAYARLHYATIPVDAILALAKHTRSFASSNKIIERFFDKRLKTLSADEKRALGNAVTSPALSSRIFDSMAAE